MAKLGMTILNRIEPYVKVGTSNLETRWKHGGQAIEVDAKDAFAWGAGIKASIWDFKDLGLRLTGDVQYRTFLLPEESGCFTSMSEALFLL